MGHTDQWFKDADLIAAVAPAAGLFGLLTRTLKLPTDWAALVLRETGDRLLVSRGQEVAGDGVTEVMFLRTSPLELSFERDGLTTEDDYLCQVTVRLRVSLVPERSDAESFRKVLLGSSRVVRLAGVTHYLGPILTQTLTTFAEQHEVEDLVDGRCREPALRTVSEALERPCFEAGLALAGPIDVRFESEALQAVRLQQAATARHLDEHAAQAPLRAALSEARARHLRDLESTLKRLQELAAASPNAPLPDLIRTFAEAERAKLYAALFESQPVVPATRWMVVAGGQELVFFAPDSLEAPARRVPLEGPIGPIRSIQTATGPGPSSDSALRVPPAAIGSVLSPQSSVLRLFAGAARGVYELDIDAGSPETIYGVPDATGVRGGVNSVALCGPWLFATHSELGLLRWDRSKPDSCTPCSADLTRGAHAVRHVQVADGRIVFSVDERIISLDPQYEDDLRVYAGSTSAITALLAVGPDLFAGNADGQVLHWPQGRTASPEILHGGSRRPAESVILVTTGGVPRLFFTDTTLAVFARVLGDTFTCRYEAGGQTLQRARVASDLIVAIDDPRHRLLVWRPNRTDRPITTLHVARLTGHSIQDVTLVPLQA